MFKLVFLQRSFWLIQKRAAAPVINIATLPNEKRSILRPEPFPWDLPQESQGSRPEKGQRLPSGSPTNSDGRDTSFLTCDETGTELSLDLNHRSRMECRDRKGENEMRGASARIRESSWERWMARLNRRGNKTGDRNERMLIHACILLLFDCFRRTTSYLIKSIAKYGTQLVKKRKKYHCFSLVQPAFFVNDTRRQRSMLVRILEENKTQRTVGNSIVDTESHVSFRVLLIAEW
jgi:hypothetical protein